MVADLVLQTLRHALSALQAERIPAAVMGGIAAAFWNLPRFTRDVDLLVAVNPADTERIIKAFRNSQIHTTQRPPLVSLDSISLLPFSYEPAESFIEVRVDLVLSDGEFQQQALERRVVLSAEGHDYYVLACEDLILFKLLAGRIIDRADAAALLRINRQQLDLKHLVAWSRRLALEEDLAEVWEEAFPGEDSPEKI